MLQKNMTIALSLLLGICLELGVHWATGRREAWDSGAYWTIGLPLVIVGSIVLGYTSIGRAWLWTSLVIPGQVVTMMVRSGEFGSLWPLTLILSAILSAPFVGAAFVGSLMRPRS
jgi:hypothetical protein